MKKTDEEGKFSDNITCKRINEFMENSNLNYSSLARELNYDSGTIRRYCIGKTKISLDFIVQFSKHYEVSTDWLLGLTDEQGKSYKRLSYYDLLIVFDILLKNKSIYIEPLKRYMDEERYIQEQGHMVIYTEDRFLGKLLEDLSEMPPGIARKQWIKSHKPALSCTELLKWEDNFIEELNRILNDNPNNVYQTAEEIRMLSDPPSEDNSTINNTNDKENV